MQNYDSKKVLLCFSGLRTKMMELLSLFEETGNFSPVLYYAALLVWYIYSALVHA